MNKEENRIKKILNELNNMTNIELVDELEALCESIGSNTKYDKNNLKFRYNVQVFSFVAKFYFKFVFNS